MFENKLKEYLDDVNERVYMYQIELQENNIYGDDSNILINLCIESNFCTIHDMLSAENFSEYNKWMVQNINKKNLYCEWLQKRKQEEEAKHLRRYSKIIQRK
jgi:hypothetical protein